MVLNLQYRQHRLSMYAFYATELCKFKVYVASQDVVFRKVVLLFYKDGIIRLS